jgi:hypothetical protein
MAEILFVCKIVPGEVKSISLTYNNVRVMVCYRHFQHYFSYIVAVSFIGGENHRPVASHWQTLSHNVVSSTPRLSRIRTHYVSGDRL